VTQNVPKIVTDRLRAAMPLVNHPDADVLTAFSEHSLPQGERAIVLEHLAACGDCREIVALALPAVEAPQTVIRPASTGWLSWPALRWGFVAVGVFAIASLGVVQYRKQLAHREQMASVAPSATVKEAKNEAPAPPIQSSADDREKVKVPAAPVPESASGGKEKPASAPAEFDRLESFTSLQKAENKAKKAIGARVGSGLGGPTPHGPMVLQNTLNQNVQNQSALNYQASNDGPLARGATTAPSPSVKQAPNAFMDADTSAAAASQTVEVQAQAQPVEVQGRNPQPLQLEKKNLELEPTQGGQGHTDDGTKESGLVVGVSRAKVPVNSPAAPGAFTGALSPPNASWTIAAGGLQRSLDQGKTWQNVNVNAIPAAAANYALEVQAVSADDAKRDDAKRDKDAWSKRAKVTPPVFRAVVANGPDVWAGGSTGLLYHSVDSGAHWTRVQPSAGGTVLTGDVVTLDFPDSQHGKVTTSTPEVWLTADDGQSWQKQ
jgi:hypothetical protein